MSEETQTEPQTGPSADQKFGLAVKYLVKAEGRGNRQAVCDRAGVSLITLNRIQNGQSVSWRQYELVCGAFECTTREEVIAKAEALSKQFDSHEIARACAAARLKRSISTSVVADALGISASHLLNFEGRGVGLAKQYLEKLPAPLGFTSIEEMLETTKDWPVPEKRTRSARGEGERSRNPIQFKPKPATFIPPEPIVRGSWTGYLGDRAVTPADSNLPQEGAVPSTPVHRTYAKLTDWDR